MKTRTWLTENKAALYSLLNKWWFPAKWRRLVGGILDIVYLMLSENPTAFNQVDLSSSEHLKDLA